LIVVLLNFLKKQIKENHFHKTVLAFFK
jgi:hypothetical protein